MAKRLKIEECLFVGSLSWRGVSCWQGAGTPAVHARMKVGAAMATEMRPDDCVKHGPVWVKANKQEDILFFFS